MSEYHGEWSYQLEIVVDTPEFSHPIVLKSYGYKSESKAVAVGMHIINNSECHILFAQVSGLMKPGKRARWKKSHNVFYGNKTD